MHHWSQAHGHAQQGCWYRCRQQNSACFTIVHQPASALLPVDDHILQVLLCLGYCHLLHLRDAAACLKCCEALRQLETPQAAHPAVALLAFQAFMAQGSLEQAEQEATGEAGKGVMGKLWGARRRRRAQVGGKGEDKGIVQQAEQVDEGEGFDPADPAREFAL